MLPIVINGDFEDIPEGMFKYNGKLYTESDYYKMCESLPDLSDSDRIFLKQVEIHRMFPNLGKTSFVGLSL